MEKQVVEKIMKMWKQKKGVPHIAFKLELPDKEVRDVVQDPRNYHVEEDGEKHIQDLMLDVQQILHRHENGFDVHTIGVKMRLAESYIQKVVDTGATDMEMYLRKMYNVPKPVLPAEAEAVVEETTSKKKKTITPQVKKGESGTREKAIVQAITEGKETVEDIGNRANEILNITRKCWAPGIYKAVKLGMVLYDKETKKYSLPT